MIIMIIVGLFFLGDISSANHNFMKTRANHAKKSSKFTKKKSARWDFLDEKYYLIKN